MQSRKAIRALGWILETGLQDLLCNGPLGVLKRSLGAQPRLLSRVEAVKVEMRSGQSS